MQYYKLYIQYGTIYINLYTYKRFFLVFLYL